jgi:hypothetical protein
LIDHALALQQIGNIANAQASGDINDFVLSERAGYFESLLANKQAGTYGNRRYDEEREYCIANHDDRMTRAPRMAGRSRHPFWFQGGARTARQSRLAGRQTAVVDALPSV